MRISRALVIASIFLGSTTFSLFARQELTKEAAFLASRSFTHSVDLILEQMKADFSSKEFEQPRISLLTSYVQSSNLSDEFRTYVIDRVINASLVSSNGYKIVKCLECLTVRMELDNEDIHLKKGVNGHEEMQGLVKKYGVSGWTEINVIQVGSDLQLSLILFDEKGQSIIAKEYRKPVYAIRDGGAVMSLSFNFVTTEKKSVGSLMGGRLGVGQRIPRFGEVGLFGSGFMSPTIVDPLTIFGLYFDLDLNDIFQGYWRIGSLLLTHDVGIGLYNGAAQFSYAPGLKFKLGSLFHIQAGYTLFQNFASQAEKDKGAKQVEKSDQIVKPSQTLPGMFVLGLGIDVG
jgi:hypothetical protein